MSKTFARVLYGATMALAAAFFFIASAARAADDWVNFATVSMTNATTPKLTNGYGCYTDGKDVLCDSASSAITFGTGGLFDMGGLTVAGSISAAAVSATYVSGTVIQVNASTMPCSTGLNGAIRYSSINNSLEVCIGTTWSALSSNTTPGNANVAGASTNVQYNNNGALGGDNNFTYVSATGTISASGAYYSGDSNAYFYNNLTTPVLVFDANDYLRYTRSSNVYDFLIGGNPMVTINGSGNLLVGNLVSATLFYGANGTVAAPTYSFANDTNSGFYRPASNIIGVSIGSAEIARFTAGGISATGTVNAAQVSSTYTSSTLVQVGDGAGASCVAGLNGAIRYNSTSNTIDVCVGTAWTSLNSGTITGSGISGGSATAVAFWNGPNSLTYESTTTSGLYWDHANGRLGVGSNVPTSALDVSGSGHIRWVSGTGAGIWYDGKNTANRTFVGTDASSGDSGFRVWSAAKSTNVLYADLDTGNVLIGGAFGAVSPTATLQVSGSMIVSTTGQNTAAAASLLVDSRGVSVSSIVHINGSAFSPIGAGGNVILSGSTIVSTSSAGSITMYTGGAQRLGIDNAGNVGIGTATPTQVLTVNGAIQTGINGNNGQVNFGGTSEYVGSNYASHLVAIGTNGAERMRIDSSGNVGIGTTSLGAASVTVVGMSGANGNGELVLYSGSTAGQWTRFLSNILAGNYNPAVAAGDHAIIFSNGTAGTGAFIIAPWSASSSGLKIASNGNVTIAGSGTTCTIGSGTGTTSCTSDRRLKDRIQPINGALEKLMLIRGVTYHWKDPAKAGPEHIGVIAQDVQQAFPQAVDEVSNTAIGTAKTVDYAVLVAPMIESMRELKTQNDDLRADLKAANDNIQTLSSDFESLREEVRQLKQHQK